MTISARTEETEPVAWQSRTAHWLVVAVVIAVLLLNLVDRSVELVEFRPGGKTES